MAENTDIQQQKGGTFIPMLQSPRPGEATLVAKPEEIKDAIDELLADTGRDINREGVFEIEITPDRTRDDLFNNRPGAHLREKILGLPDAPGVYMYLDKHGKVIYVGKAKRLKRRVSS